MLRALLLAVLPLVALGLLRRYVRRFDRSAFRRAGALVAVSGVAVLGGCSNGTDAETFLAVLRNGLLSGDTSTGLPGGTYFFHRTHIGSSSVITDATGVQVQKIVYEPYGAVDQGKSTNASASMNVTKMFTGQEYDPETALYNYKARYYDPATGTFTSPDSIVPGSGTQDYNRYMYANGNPVRFTDPTGHMADAQWDGGGRTSAQRYYHSPAGRTGYRGGSSSSYGARSYGNGYRSCAGYACGTSAYVRTPRAPVYQAYGSRLVQSAGSAGARGMANATASRRSPPPNYNPHLADYSQTQRLRTQISLQAIRYPSLYGVLVLGVNLVLQRYDYGISPASYQSVMNNLKAVNQHTMTQSTAHFNESNSFHQDAIASFTHLRPLQGGVELFGSSVNHIASDVASQVEKGASRVREQWQQNPWWQR